MALTAKAIAMSATRADIRHAAGQLIICGFESDQVSPELRDVMTEVNPLGLILFSRNLPSVEHAQALTHELKSLRPRPEEPLLLCVDQEGGRVARLKAPCTEWPPMRSIGAANDADLARKVGAALAAEMRALNFDVDFAPVLDVDTNPNNPIIGHRAFSDDPAKVAALGAAFIRGMQGGGVSACGKHYPGHGDTDQDSHLTLPHLKHDAKRLAKVEYPPFQAAIDAGVAAIMTAHVVIDSLDSVPATLSAKALDPLRRQFGFTGVIISDDIEMRAVADSYSPAAMAGLGLQAGIDVFLSCRKPEVVLELYRGIIQAYERGDVSSQTIIDRAKRAAEWRQTYYQPAKGGAAWQKVVGCAQHLALAEHMRRFA